MIAGVKLIEKIGKAEIFSDELLVKPLNDDKLKKKKKA